MSVPSRFAAIVVFVVASHSSFMQLRAADSLGLLVVHPDNPRYVMVKDDPARKAVCLTGAHTWAEFQTYQQESPSSTRYCLYEEGKEYLVYQPAHETPFTVELPAGSFRYGWINPVSGVTKRGVVDSKGGKVSFTAPFPWPAGLHLTGTSITQRMKATSGREEI